MPVHSEEEKVRFYRIFKATLWLVRFAGVAVAVWGISQAAQDNAMISNVARFDLVVFGISMGFCLPTMWCYLFRTIARSRFANQKGPAGILF
jgi:hypothetical protein